MTREPTEMGPSSQKKGASGKGQQVHGGKKNSGEVVLEGA